MSNKISTEFSSGDMFSISKRVSLLLRAINNKFRQNIITLLEVNPRLTVTEIFIKLRQSQSVTSQHLAVLRRAGILDTTRAGKTIFYSLNQAILNKICGCLKTVYDESEGTAADSTPHLVQLYELNYLMNMTGASCKQVYDAVLTVGSCSTDIIEYLKIPVHEEVMPQKMTVKENWSASIK